MTFIEDVSIAEHDQERSRNGSSEDSQDSVSSRKSSMESVISSDSAMTDVNEVPVEVSATTSAGSNSTPNTTTAVQSTSSATTQEGNNNSLPKEISYAELELLKKLEEQNR